MENALNDKQIQQAADAIRPYVNDKGIERTAVEHIARLVLGLPDEFDFTGGRNWQRIMSRVRVSALKNVTLPNGKIVTIYYPRGTVLPKIPGTHVLYELSAEDILSLTYVADIPAPLEVGPASGASIKAEEAEHYILVTGAVNDADETDDDTGADTDKDQDVEKKKKKGKKKSKKDKKKDKKKKDKKKDKKKKRVVLVVKI